ncbi:uncharacterized protein [Haliotis asinina]|uniref:uncharacterized protein n=1 Tax=Haliotis asinina TaxID=109174 RepID=UPI003531D8FA
MDNSSLDKHDLPETSEILAPFGSIAFEGSLRSHKNTLTVDDGTVRSKHQVFRRNSVAPQETSSRPGVGGVFQDNETGYRRKESVVYAQRGKAEVTFINIQLDKTNDQDIGKAKWVKVFTATDDKTTPEAAVPHNEHFAEEENQNGSQAVSPSIHTKGVKDTSNVKPGPLYVSDTTVSRTLFRTPTEISGSSDGVVLDPGQLDSDPSQPLREEEVCYVRKPTTARVVGVRRLSEGSSPSGAAIGDPRTTHEVSIIQHSDGSPLKTSPPAPNPDRDNKSPPGRKNNSDGVLDKGNTETIEPYQSGTFVKGTDISEGKALKITEAGVMHSRAFPVSRDTKDIHVSSPASQSAHVTKSRTMTNTDISSSIPTGRKHKAPSLPESSGTMLKAIIPVLASNANIIQSTDAPSSTSTESALKRITTTPKHVNVVNSDTFQEVDPSAKSGLVPDFTSIAQNIASSEASASASQRNSVASGCSYVSSVVDAQSRLDLESCSPTHFHTKWRLYNTETSGTGLREDCSVEIRPDVLHVKDTRTLTSTMKDSKEMHRLNTDKAIHNNGLRDSGTGDFINSLGNPALSGQYHVVTATKGSTGTPTDTQNEHDPKILQDSVPNIGNDRATKLIGKDNPYFPDRNGTKSKPREQIQSPHMVNIPRPQWDQGQQTISKTQIHNYEDDLTHDSIMSKARVNKQSSHMVGTPRRDKVKHISHDYEKGDLTERNTPVVRCASLTDGTRMARRVCVHVLDETKDSSDSGDETRQRRFPDQGRRRKEGRIQDYNGKDELCPGRAVEVKHSTMSHKPYSGETSVNRKAGRISDGNNTGSPTVKGKTCNSSSADTGLIIVKAGKGERARDTMGGTEGNEAQMDTQSTHQHPKEHRKHHDKFEYPTHSMRDALLASKGYAGVMTPGVVEYNDNRTERSNVVEDNEINGHQSVMDRVKSWVVRHDTSESTSARDPSRDNTDSPRPFDRHSIAEMPLKVLETAVPIDQEDVYPDEVFENRAHGAHKDPSVGDSQYLEPRQDLPVGEHLHLSHDVLIREDPEGSEGLARRRFDSLSTDPRTVYSRSLSDGFRKIEESNSKQVSIEMAELGNGSDVTVTRHQSEGAIFNTSLLDGWEPSSPYAHRVKRNSSTLSEGAQPISSGKPKVRQLSLAIGEEWEDMTGTHPVTSPDGTGSVAVSQRSLRRERSQQRSWSGCSTSSAPRFLGRTIRYMSHPARLENYLRRNTIPEGNEPTTNTQSLATTTVETVDVEERKPAQLETRDDEKRWLTPNPYNRINQRFHSTLQCPCYLFFCFLCCVPAVYYMQISDKEYDYGSKEKSRVYGRRATVLYVIGAISATIFLSTITSLVVIFMQEYLTRQQT